MYFRFVIGGSDEQKAMIGFTVKAKDQFSAILAAQTVVDGLNLYKIKENEKFDGDIGNKTIAGTEAFNISIYAGDGTLITEDNIEDSWDEALGA